MTLKENLLMLQPGDWFGLYALLADIIALLPDAAESVTPTPGD